MNPLLYYLSRRVVAGPGLPPSTLSSSRLFHHHHRHRARDPNDPLGGVGADRAAAGFLRYDDAIDDDDEFTSNESEEEERGGRQAVGGVAARTASGSSAKALLQNRSKMPPNARVCVLPFIID